MKKIASFTTHVLLLVFTLLTFVLIELVFGGQ